MCVGFWYKIIAKGSLVANALFILFNDNDKFKKKKEMASEGKDKISCIICNKLAKDTQKPNLTLLADFRWHNTSPFCNASLSLSHWQVKTRLIIHKLFFSTFSLMC